MYSVSMEENLQSFADFYCYSNWYHFTHKSNKLLFLRTPLRGQQYTKMSVFFLHPFLAYLVPLIPASPLPLTSFFSLHSVLPSYLWSCPVANQQHLLYSQSLNCSFFYLFLCVATPSCVVRCVTYLVSHSTFYPITFI